MTLQTPVREHASQRIKTLKHNNEEGLTGRQSLLHRKVRKCLDSVSVEMECETVRGNDMLNSKRLVCLTYRFEGEGSTV